MHSDIPGHIPKIEYLKLHMAVYIRYVVSNLQSTLKAFDLSF